MKKLTIARVAIFGVVFTLVAFYLHDFQSGERKMIALLNGDASVEVVRLMTKNQQRRLECTDTDVLRYLKEAMMKHPPGTIGVGGHSYRGLFEFKGGGTFEGPISVGTNGFDLAVGKHPNPDEIPTHSVPLVEPVPERVKQIFAFLGEPWQQAAGSVFILEPGKPPRRERDESLVAK